jgi:hypothetical protein
VVITLSCPVCRVSLDSDQLVCQGCGALRAPPHSLDEERLALHQWRLAFRGLKVSAGERYSEAIIRSRKLFVEQALIPSGFELALEEAVFCQQLPAEDPILADAARARLEALLTQLELLALKEPLHRRRLEVLRQSIERADARTRASNRNAFVGCGITLAVLIGAGFLLPRACS